MSMRSGNNTRVQLRQLAVFSASVLVILLHLGICQANVVIDSTTSKPNFTSESPTNLSKFQEFMCPSENDTESLHFCGNETNSEERQIPIHNANDTLNIGQNGFNNSEFCLKSVSDKYATFVFCKTSNNNNTVPEKNSEERFRTVETTSKTLTFRKCCSVTDRLLVTSSGAHNEMKRYECVTTENNVPWNPAIFPTLESEFSDHIDLQNLSEKITYEIKYPTCRKFKELNNNQDIWFKIIETGEVFVGLKFWFRPVWLPVHDMMGHTNHTEDEQPFCLDELIEHGDESSHEIFHKNQVLLYCGIDRFNDYLFHRKLFGGLCVTASCIIFILLVIYMSIWDKQNLAGWTQFNIFVAIFFVFGMEGVRTLVDYNGLNVQATGTCLIIAAIAQYFFFALNTTWCVMNFDLLWTFWKLESSVKGVEGNGRRILAYLAFSWGLPLLVIIFAFGIKHIEASDSKGKMEGVYAYSHRRCSSPIREFGFQTQGVMFLCNVVFFGFTAFLLWKHRRGITNHRRNSRSEKYTWRSVILFAKLLIVMGVSSMSIPIDYFFGSKDPLNFFEVLFRMVHFIPVVAILGIFGCNEKNLFLIKQKYPNLGNIIPLRSLTANRVDTNPSRSGGHNSTEIR